MSKCKHHIDSAIVLDILKDPKSKDGMHASQYFYRLDKDGAEGIISLIALGEIFGDILKTDGKNPAEAARQFNDFCRWVKLKKLHLMYSFPDGNEEHNECCDILKDLKENYRLNPADAQIVVCAISDKANFLVTKDTKMLYIGLVEKVKNDNNLHIKRPENI